jgi:hypothetical protein
MGITDYRSISVDSGRACRDMPWIWELAGLDAIVQRLERYGALGKLAFQVLVAVDVELGVV